MNDCIAAVDLGTTAVKVCLFDREFRLIRKSVKEYPLRFQGENRAEAEAETYTEAVRAGFREVLGKDERVLGLVFTTQGETFTAVDASGQPLMPFTVWLDSRAVEAAERLKKAIPEDDFYRETGLPCIDGALPLAKLAMIAGEEPELYRRTAKFLLLEDYFLFLCTGRFVTEKALQTSTGWFSLKTDGYSGPYLEIAGIDRDKLPDLVNPGDTVGTLRPETAEMWGLPEGIPVAAGAMDQTAAALAIGCTGEGSVAETTGTALTMVACSGEPFTECRHRLTVYRHAIPGKYLCLAIGNTGGRSLTWFRDCFCEGADYDTLNRMAASVPAGSGGVQFLPYLSGEVDPDNIPEATGVFCGLKLSTGKAEMIRSIMEGIAYQLKEYIALFRDRNCPVNRVFSLGGGSASIIWEQIKADICGVDFLIPETGEMAARGAAMLAARAAGLNESGQIPAPRVIRKHTPDPESERVYERAWRDYRQLYQAMLTVYKGGRHYE